MIDLKNCKSLNDIARLIFGKENYINREKCKKILKDEGIDWEKWLEEIKSKKNKQCLFCGKEFTPKYKEQKFCSTSCSATYNNMGRKQSEETRRKISEAIQRKSDDFDGVYKPLSDKSKRFIKRNLYEEKEYCLNCGEELKYGKTFCSSNCQHEYNREEYIKRWKKGEESGLKGQYGLSRVIRNYLLEKQNYKCEICGWGETNQFTNTIPLEIHHKDGDYINNKEENLQVLCPNCHSLTETHKSHNKKGRQGRKEYYKNK